MGVENSLSGAEGKAEHTVIDDLCEVIFQLLLECNISPGRPDQGAVAVSAHVGIPIADGLYVFAGPRGVFGARYLLAGILAGQPANVFGQVEQSDHREIARYNVGKQLRYQERS